VLTYTITIENTGNVSLTGVTATDTLPDGTAGSLTGPVTDTGATNVLDMVDQSAIDTGTPQVNSVSVVTNETGDTPFSDTAQTDIERSPAYTVAKSVDKSDVSAPELLTYNIVVENTGNVSLTNVVASDVGSIRQLTTSVRKT